jgi:transcriptional regulator with XRE-family HTH domain
MDVERGKAILEKSGVTKQYFASLLGVKPITVRLAFSNKRLSKKMVGMLESMETEIIRKEEDKEITELIASVSEVPVLDDVRTAKVSVVKVKRESGDMYTLEGKYDGRDRLV